MTENKKPISKTSSLLIFLCAVLLVSTLVFGILLVNSNNKVEITQPTIPTEVPVVPTDAADSTPVPTTKPVAEPVEVETSTEVVEVNVVINSEAKAAWEAKIIEKDLDLYSNYPNECAKAHNLSAC